ncbi:FAD binding domain-containing protein [Streptomyces sp. NRRL F-2664]|uniref:FAD binding domain-containing protein n=1 Tax=Streptomyces sp. NRRL F-2664 TaxID=1463842 RepID=UPI00068B483E|nr:FAD binding domain-containing protein [Streptomyces sp. NRRL F-2664]
MILTEFDYVRPARLDEALALLAGTPGARVLAGGQSLLPDLRAGADAARLLVDIRRLPDLRGTARTPDGRLRIGALTPLADLTADPLVLAEAPELAAAARGNGDPQVRNLGTAGGNLAATGRATDLPVAAIAADALVELAGPGGRTTLAAEEFVAGGAPGGEIVTALLVPAAGPAAAFEKSADRATRYPVCATAVRITSDGPRIAVTGATPRPLRLRGVEQRLRGGPYSTQAVLAAFRAEPRELFVPGRGTSAEYLGHLAGVLTARALQRAERALA